MAKEPKTNDKEGKEEKRGGMALPSAPQSLMTLREEMDRVFNDFARHWTISPFHSRVFDWEPFRRMERATGVLMPETDVVEGEDAIRVSVELPGMEEEDVEVELTEDTLTISGEKREKREEKEEDYHLSERSYGMFKRTLRVPDTVETGKVNAEMKNGILTVTMPKTEKATQKPKKVSVKKG